MNYETNGNLKLAIQKKGRLTEKSLLLLKNCGLDIDNYKDRLLVPARNFKLDLLFVRDDDIPEYVQDGVADIGIIGLNVYEEKNAEADIIKELGFGKCQLMIGMKEDEKLISENGLEGKTIATSYPNILEKYLTENKINSKVIQISGSVEIAPSLGVADFICDIVSTGNTMKLNKLKKAFPIFSSQSVLIANKNLSKNEKKAELLNDLLARIDSVLTAKKSNYLMMNVETDSLDQVIEILPSLKSPTILPLAEGNMTAVHAVIPTDKFWDIKEDLINAGGTGILLLPINNMIR